MATKKKAARYGDVKIPAQSLAPFDKDGFMTKQGGSIKSWNKRYFVLKDKYLYYYKTPKDSSFTGRIDIESNSICKDEPEIKKSPNIFSISTAHRVFFMYPDRTDEVKPWVDAINKNIERFKGTPSNNETSNGRVETSSTNSSTSPSSTTSQSNNTTSNAPAAASHPPAAFSGADMSPRVRLSLAKGVINFLKDPESKVLEFWQIWSESIPSKEDLTPGMNIEFQVSTTADMQKLSWRTSGPQNIFIQKMVDFFWNVGAPESEIDRLNDVGALINPIRIGSWIDMSAKGGMDGGWFFPEDIPLKRAIESADAGEAVTKFNNWSERHGITNIFIVGRDMGAAPPRQTELRLKIPGNDYNEQLAIGLDAFSSFGFPPLPDYALRTLKESTPDAPLLLSVITSSEGFVRLGLLVPNPKTESVLSLCSQCGGNQEELAAFEASLGKDVPSFIEYQFLMKSFGYGVYKEGFDVVFHYIVGEETA